MAITAQDFLLLAEAARGGLANGSTCKGCGIVLQETKTGCRWTSEGSFCSDCYFDRLGDAVEQHPIATASIRRG